MPLGAARIALFSRPQVVAEAEVIRAKVGVSAEGNAQISTTESQFGGASAVFARTGTDRLIADTEGIVFESIADGDYTIEMWVYPTQTDSTTTILLDPRVSVSNPNVFFEMRNRNGNYRISYFSGGEQVGDTDISNNAWTHLAWVRTSGVVKGYVNGVLDLTYSHSVTFIATGFGIGGRGKDNSDFELTGNLDEVRISNTARYTANFTPPTEPFTNDANTLLLLHMDGTDGSQFFEDDNGVRPKIGMQTKGTPQISTTQSKFGGASLRCDGSFSSDAIGLPTGYGLWNGVGTGDFSMECWFYIENDVQNDILDTRDANAPLEFDYPTIFHRETNTLDVFIENSLVITSGNGVVTPGQWEHVALVRQNGVFTAYLNGTQVGSTFSSSIDMTGAAFGVGDYFFSGGGSADFDGWIDEVRASNTARYTANFTPQTEPHVNDANTLLLLHMDGTDASTDFFDDNGVRAKVGVSAFGNAQLSNTQSKFSNTSLILDGTITPTDFVKANTNTLEFGTGDFTFEFWQYSNSFPGQNKFWFDARGTTTSSNGLLFSGNSALTELRWFYGGTLLINTGNNAITTAVWQHIAVVRNSGVTKIFVDGIEKGSANDTNNYIAKDFVNIGARSLDDQASGIDGFIDEFRISNTARYTANFTPSSTAFTNDANTLLLLHMDGTDGSQTFVDDNGVPPNHDYGA